MLQWIVFACGAALMGLEMVAARVLAPYLGNSIYVWGAVISVVMIALSLGYALGGQLADRFGASRVMPPVIAAAAAATIAAPLVAAAVLPLVADFGARIGSLLAATSIFFVPALLLAMVSPLGVRIASRSGIERIGRTAGGLYAISTAGSIVGTLATSFWLIPALSLEPLLVWTGFGLVAVALSALALRPDGPEGSTAGDTYRRLTLPLAVGAIALGVFVLWRVAPVPEKNAFGEIVLFRQDTQYHRITVTEGDGARHLRFDRSHQSAIDIADPFISRVRYPDYMHLAIALKPDPERVLVIGLGGGAITRRYWRDYPDAVVDTVEIDPVVVDVARRYFWLPEDDRLGLFVEDGRRYVQRTSETYDIVIVDAYYADSLPYHLTTVEFYEELRSVMTTDGVVAFNIIASAAGEDSDLFRSMYRTSATVWRELWVFPIGYGSDGRADARRNIILLATDSDLSEQELRSRIASAVDGRVTIEGYASMAADLYTEPIPLEDVPLLTDSHAPTDALIRVQ